MKDKDSQVDKAAKTGYQRHAITYEQARPDYPKHAVELLVSGLGIGKTTRVLDLAAGTGKFTRLIADKVGTIAAVEPVDEMLTILKEHLPQVTALRGTAQNIPLPDKSIDVVFIAQAFHWFASPESIKEIHRILDENGGLGLIWNVRDEDIPWVSALTHLIDPYAGDTPRYRTFDWKTQLENSGLFGTLEEATFPYQHQGTVETIVKRVISTSFIAALPSKILQEVELAARKIAMSASDINGQISYPYKTMCYWCFKQ